MERSIQSIHCHQKKVVLAAIDTIIKFLQNEESYIPFRATVVGCGGTGKSYIINTILTIVRKLTKRNATILVGAPSEAAAYNVQGSTLHHLLGIGVLRPEDNIICIHTILILQIGGTHNYFRTFFGMTSCFYSFKCSLITLLGPTLSPSYSIEPFFSTNSP